MKRILCSKILFGLILAILIAAGSASADPWKFGVISDTQWTHAPSDPANQNPNTCAASIIKQIDEQFIANEVKLVVHVGDMVDVGSQQNDYTRALYVQRLYNAGIGFYPLRGNHEAANGAYTGSSADYRHTYPQILPIGTPGLNNATPADVAGIANIPGAVTAANPPLNKTNPNMFVVGTNFSAPDATNTANDSVSYAFDYNNATFMLLDQFKSPDYYTSYIPAQQSWIDSTLSGRPANTHAFLFTHKNILGGNHKDNMFGGTANGNDPGDGYRLDLSNGIVYPIDPSTQIPYADYLGNNETLGDKQAAENTFLASMQTHHANYMISGHDHHHYNSVVMSPDGLSKVHQLITQSDSSKFYTPGLPVSPNDVPVEQDLARVDYYIFTVDGPRVTIDYYADNHGSWLSDTTYPYDSTDLVNYPLRTTPTFTFVKRSTTGYSLNGQEKLVAQNASYAMTDDTTVAATMESGFLGTSMAILSGTNGSMAATNYGRPTEKAVNTGWAPKGNDVLDSEILTLWGMTDLGAAKTDTYALSMTYNPGHSEHLGNGGFGIATKDADGNWVNAVDKVNATPMFVKGPWKASYGPGTYGVDASTKTAWAVIDYDGTFAVANGIEPVPGHRK
jgi:calcineurin-like phosphoesterase family protein